MTESLDAWLHRCVASRGRLRRHRRHRQSHQGSLRRRRRRRRNPEYSRCTQRLAPSWSGETKSTLRRTSRRVDRRPSFRSDAVAQQVHDHRAQWFRD
jgi:hypothetical protein